MTTPAPPGIPVFPPGYPEVPAGMNALVKVPMSFVTTRIVFRGQQLLAQSLVSGAYRVIQLVTAEDPYSGWNATAWQWTAPYTAWYQVTVRVITAATFEGQSTGYQLTGNNVAGMACATPASFPGGGITSDTVFMTGGQDYLSAVAQVTTTVNTLVTPAWSSMEIFYVCSGYPVT